VKTRVHQFDIVAKFWLPAVELNIFDMCDHLAVLLVVVSCDIEPRAVRPSKVSIVRLKSSFQSPLADFD
jgi:hypothetical protein